MHKSMTLFAVYEHSMKGIVADLYREFVAGCTGDHVRPAECGDALS